MPITLSQSLNVINDLISTASQFRQAEQDRTERRRQFGENVRLREEALDLRKSEIEISDIEAISSATPEVQMQLLESFDFKTERGVERAGLQGQIAQSSLEQLTQLTEQKEAIQDLPLEGLFQLQSVTPPKSALAPFVKQEIGQREFQVEQQESAVEALTEAANLRAQTDFLIDFIPANKGNVNIATIRQLFNTGVRGGSPELIDRAFKLATADLTLGEAFLSGAFGAGGLFNIPSPTPQVSPVSTLAVPDTSLIDDAAVERFVRTGFLP